MHWTPHILLVHFSFQLLLQSQAVHRYKLTALSLSCTIYRALERHSMRRLRYVSGNLPPDTYAGSYAPREIFDQWLMELLNTFYKASQRIPGNLASAANSNNTLNSTLLSWLSAISGSPLLGSHELPGLRHDFLGGKSNQDMETTSLLKPYIILC